MAKHSTQISCSADALSRAADALLAKDKPLTKNSILNAMAAAIAGDGHDWGFLKNAPNGTFTQPGIPSAPAQSTSSTSVFLLQMDEREDWAREPDMFDSIEALEAYLRSDEGAPLFTGYEAEKCIEKLLAGRSLFFPDSEEDDEAYEEEEQPYSLSIYEFAVPAFPEPDGAWVLEIDFVNEPGEPTKLFRSKRDALKHVQENFASWKRLLRSPVEEVLSALNKSGIFEYEPNREGFRSDDEFFDEWDARYTISLTFAKFDQPISTDDNHSTSSTPSSEIIYVKNAPIEFRRQGLDWRDEQIHANLTALDQWAFANNLDAEHPGWRQGVCLARDCKITATFHPQVWVRDNAMEVDPEGDTAWTVDASDLDPSASDLDYLKLSRGAPLWIQEWTGPFRIELFFSTPEEN